MLVHTKEQLDSALTWLEIPRNSVAALVIVLLLCSTLLVYRSGLAFTLSPGSVLGGDQLNYLTCAKSVLQSGILESSTIYPGLLNQTFSHLYLYMPGHCLAIATGFALFGIGAWQAILPSVFGLWISVLSIYFIGLRYYSSRVGLIAALSMLFSGSSLFYAVTAMSELTVMASGLLALSIFAWMRFRFKNLLVPGILLLPFLFRETSATLIIVILAFIVYERQRIVRSVSFEILSVALLSFFFLLAIYLMPQLHRPSLWLGGFYTKDFTDAYALEGFHPTMQDFLAAAWGKFTHNWEKVYWPNEWISWLKMTPISIEYFPFIPHLIFIGIVLVAGIIRQDSIFIGSALFAALHFIMLFFLYIAGWRTCLLSNALLSLPLAKIAISIARDSPIRRSILLISTLLGVALSTWGAQELLGDFARKGQEGSQCTENIKVLQHDSSKVLISRGLECSDYIYYDFPAKWSFMPANLRTLQLLMKKFQVGTIIFDVNDPANKLFGSYLQNSGFVRSDVKIGSKPFIIYKNLM